MTRTNQRLALRTPWLLAGIALLGCTKPTPPTSESLDPDVAFNRVVQHLQHYLGQLQSSEPYLAENGAYTDFRNQYEVTKHEIIPPANPGEGYRGEIAIKTTWSFFYRPASEPDPSESQQNVNEKSKQEKTLGTDFAAGESESGDDFATPTPEGAPGFVPKAIAKSQSEEKTRTFLLAFRNNRWELAGEQDSATSVEEGEPKAGELPSEFDSTKDAIERALRQQHVGRT